MPHADLGDAHLFYTDDGAGDPALLLVHGWSCDSHDWSWQYEAFAARHRIVAADLRGHGRSSVPPDGYRPRVFAADLAGLLERLGVAQVVAVGHSLGGAIATALAVEHPNLVKAVVAVDPAYAIPARMRDAMMETATAYRAPGGHELASTAQRAMSVPATPSNLVAWHGRRVLGTPHEVVAETFSGIFEPDDQIGLAPASSEYLLRRTCPVLSLYAHPGRAERERPLMRHPYSRAVSWEGAGHWLHQERPAEFNHLVLEWVAGLS